MTEVGIYGPTALATAAGITVQGLLPLRRGVRKNVQRRPTAPVGRALGWTPDSIDLILDGGGEPVIAAATPAVDMQDTEATLAAVLEALARVERRLDALAERIEAPSPPQPVSDNERPTTGLRAL